MDDQQNQHWDEADWENRRLCSDGNCIGVVGSDGRCKMCGLRYDGASSPDPENEETDQAEPEEADTGAEIDPAGTDTGAEADPGSRAVADEEDDDWDRRTLCSDGNCIGVIGPDGRCKVCHKTAGS